MESREQFKISFIELLYAVAIGASFVLLPSNPLTFGSFVYLFTIGVCAYDWYQYHDSLQEIEKGNSFLNFLFQVIAIMLLYEMLIHSFDQRLYLWIFYFALKDLVDLVWNVTLEFNLKQLYIFTTLFEALLFFCFFYLNKVGRLSNVWMFTVVIIIFVFLWFFEKKFDKS